MTIIQQLLNCVGTLCPSLVLSLCYINFSAQVETQQTTQSSQSQPMAMLRPPVAVPSSSLQQLIIQPTQAGTGHVILQPGQQLISTATGQHVLTTVDGRTQQMTIVQGGAASGQAVTPAATSLLVLVYILVSLSLNRICSGMSHCPVCRRPNDCIGTQRLRYTVFRFVQLDVSHLLFYYFSVIQGSMLVEAFCTISWIVCDVSQCVDVTTWQQIADDSNNSKV